MKLQEKDLDQLTAAMFIFVHAAERVVREMAMHFEAIDRNSKQYKHMCKTQGKIKADLWLHEEELKIILQNKGNMMHKWLDAAHKLLAVTDQATSVGLMSRHEGVSECELFSAMLNDSQWMIRLFLLQGNIRPDDYDKVEEALRKLWDKDHHPVRSKLIELFSKKID